MHTVPRRRAVAVAGALACAALASGGCFFSFDRDGELQPGDVTGRAMRPLESGGEAVAPYARISVDGTGRAVRAEADGTFRVRGLPPGGWTTRLVDDLDGDGWPDLTAQRSFSISVVPHATGLFGSEEEPRATFALLGDIRLSGPGELAGRVVRENGDPAVGARVVVYRSVEVPGATVDGAGTTRASYQADDGVEAETASDADGRFFFEAVAAGDVRVVALREEAGTLFMSEPAEVTVAEGARTDTGDLQLTNGVPLRQVQIELAPAPAADETVHVQFVRPGERVQLFNSDNFPTTGTLPGGPSIVLEAPIGEWDVWVQTSSGAHGTLYGRLADRPGRALVVWGLVRLSELGACVGEDEDGDEILDCDDDGLQGLPPLADYDDPNLAIWRGCVEACADAFGAFAGGASCTYEGEVYDCDDDGDGQSDVTEDLFCYGPGGGTDWDGDGLCGPNDPYPQCASNDPADPACGADRPDATPAPLPRPEYTGQRPDAGPSPDAGFDAGPADDDAGPPPADGGFDGGAPPADAGTDAGPMDGGFDAGFDAGPPIVLEDRGQDGTFALSPQNPVGDVEILGVEAVGYGDDPGFVIVGETSGTFDLYGCAFSSTETVGFVARLSAAGACEWATKLAGASVADAGPSSFSVAAVGPDYNGLGVALTGRLDGALDVTAPDATVTSLSAAQGFYLLQIDASGAVVFGDAFDTDAAITPTAVTTSWDGQVFLAGTLNGTTSLLGVEGASIALSSAADEAFVATFSTSNLWFDSAFSFGGTGESWAHELAFETGYGGVFLRGAFTGDLPDGQSGTLTANGETMFVASLGSGASGVDWVVDFPGASSVEAGLAALPGEVVSVLVGGSARGPLTVGGVTDIPTGASQAFLAVLDADTGARDEVRLFGGDGASSSGGVTAITLSSDGALRLGGFFTGQLSVPGAGGDIDLLPTSTGTNAFVARYASGGDTGILPSVADWAAATDGDVLPKGFAGLADESTVVVGDLIGPTTFTDLALYPPGAQQFVWRVLFNGQSGDRACATPDECPFGVCGRDGLCVPSCNDWRDTCAITDFCNQPTGLCEAQLDTRVWLDDQWVFNGEVWTEQAIATPGFRSGFAMQNGGSATLLFGGRDDGDALRNDTWRYAAGAWSAVATTGAPSARELMAHTTGAGADLWVFGGWDGGASDELWSYDDSTSTWTEVTQQAPWPPARWDAALAAVGSDLWLFGGVGASGQVLQDLWVFDGTGWSQPTVADPNFSAPPRLHAHAMHAEGEYFVIAGGFDAFGFESSATYRLINGDAGIEWAPADYSLDPRARAMVAYDQNFSELLITGGVSGGAPRNDSAGYYLGTWSNYGTEPWPARSEGGLVYDSNELGLLVYGGLGAPLRWVGGVTSDQLELAIPIASGWTEDPPATTPPFVAGAAYTTVFEQGQSPRFVLFGGIDPNNGARSNDLWEWTGTDWTRSLDPMDATPWPSPRSDAALTYDPCTGNVLLFGGEVDAGERNDLWVWDGTTWQSDPEEGSWPPPRRNAVLSFVPQAGTGLTCPQTAPNQALLFGGEDEGGMLTDTWLLDLNLLGQTGSPWTASQVLSVPWGVSDVAATPVTDPEPAVLLFGGWDSYGGGYTTGGTWLWRPTNNSFSQRYPMTRPDNRTGAAMTTHPSTGAAVLFGGSDAPPGGVPVLFGDTWIFESGDWVQKTDAVDADARNRAALGASDNAFHLVGGSEHPRTSPPRAAGSQDG